MSLYYNFRTFYCSIFNANIIFIMQRTKISNTLYPVLLNLNVLFRHCVKVCISCHVSEKFRNWFFMKLLPSRFLVSANHLPTYSQYETPACL